MMNLNNLYKLNFTCGAGESSVHPHDTNSGKKTPYEVRRAGASAFRNSDKLQLLLEQWTACQGAWRESQFYIKMQQKTKHRSVGARKWLTEGEMLAKCGDRKVVDAIIGAKLSDPEVRESHVRAHLDMNGVMTDDSRLTQV